MKFALIAVVIIVLAFCIALQHTDIPRDMLDAALLMLFCPDSNPMSSSCGDVTPDFVLKRVFWTATAVLVLVTVWRAPRD
jgi:hypothetical protein